MDQLQSVRIDLFKKFMDSETIPDALDKYNEILKLLKMEPTVFDKFFYTLMRLVYDDKQIKPFYDELIRKVRNDVYYSKRRTRGFLKDQKCLIIGGGPSGSRLAIELQLLGARVIVVEKRDPSMMNHNFVHLWPFVMSDLIQMGCNKINPKIDFKDNDYIQVKQLELILLKVALVLGVDYINNVEFITICPLSLSLSNATPTSIINAQPTTDTDTDTVTNTNTTMNSTTMISTPTVNTTSNSSTLDTLTTTVDAPIINTPSDSTSPTVTNTTTAIDTPMTSTSTTDNPTTTDNTLINNSINITTAIDTSIINTTSNSTSTTVTNTTSTSTSTTTAINTPITSSTIDSSTTVNASTTTNTSNAADKKKEAPIECCCDLHFDTSNTNMPNVSIETMPLGAFGHFKFYTNNQEIIDRCNRFCFNIIVDCAGKKTSVLGNAFTHKKSKSTLEIVIACNFKIENPRSACLASLLSSVDQFTHRHLFQILYQITGVDLVNYCLYKGENYFFVMMPKKDSLIKKRVLIEDKSNLRDLFDESNINRTELFHYAKSAAVFLTGADELEFVCDENGETDCKIFNFTSSSASENACCIKSIISRTKCLCKLTKQQQSLEIRNNCLLMSLCGDSLIDSFWPIGSTPGRGFFSAFDCAWMCRKFGTDRLFSFSIKENECDLLKVVAEREAIYKFLSQVTPRNVIQQFTDYTIDPSTRYPNFRALVVEPDKYKHLLDPKLWLPLK